MKRLICLRHAHAATGSDELTSRGLVEADALRTILVNQRIEAQDDSKRLIVTSFRNRAVRTALEIALFGDLVHAESRFYQDDVNKTDIQNLLAELEALGKKHRVPEVIYIGHGSVPLAVAKAAVHRVHGAGVAEMDCGFNACGYRVELKSGAYQLIKVPEL